MPFPKCGRAEDNFFPIFFLYSLRSIVSSASLLTMISYSDLKLKGGIKAESRQWNFYLTDNWHWAIWVWQVWKAHGVPCGLMRDILNCVAGNLSSSWPVPGPQSPSTKLFLTLQAAFLEKMKDNPIPTHRTLVS